MFLYICVCASVLVYNLFIVYPRVFITPNVQALSQQYKDQNDWSHRSAHIILSISRQTNTLCWMGEQNKTLKHGNRTAMSRWLSNRCVHIYFIPAGWEPHCEESCWMKMCTKKNLYWLGVRDKLSIDCGQLVGFEFKIAGFEKKKNKKNNYITIAKTQKRLGRC